MLTLKGGNIPLSFVLPFVILGWICLEDIVAYKRLFHHVKPRITGRIRPYKLNLPIEAIAKSLRTNTNGGSRSPIFPREGNCPPKALRSIFRLSSPNERSGFSHAKAPCYSGTQSWFSVFDRPKARPSLGRFLVSPRPSVRGQPAHEHRRQLTSEDSFPPHFFVHENVIEIVI